MVKTHIPPKKQRALVICFVIIPYNLLSYKCPGFPQWKSSLVLNSNSFSYSLYRFEKVAIWTPGLVFGFVLWKESLKPQVSWNIPALTFQCSNFVWVQRMSIWFRLSTTQTRHCTANGNMLSVIWGHIVSAPGFCSTFHSAVIKFPVPTANTAPCAVSIQTSELLLTF